MNAAVVRRTQEALGKVIRRPPLTEKLLNKPPFRYLHDIITEVIRVTGFMKGLYTDAEMKSDNVKDKDAKMSFLQKAIEVVVLVTGEPLSVRPARIVAGHDPERTNELLQAIGRCCLHQLSSDEAVKRVLAGEKGDARGRPPVSSRPQEADGRSGSTREDGERGRQDGEDRRAPEAGEASPGREHRRKEEPREESRAREKPRDGDRERHKEAERERERTRARTRTERAKDGDRERERRSEGGREKERWKDRDRERERDKGRDRDRDRRRLRNGEHMRDPDREKSREHDRADKKSAGSGETSRKLLDGAFKDGQADPEAEPSSRASRTMVTKASKRLPKNSLEGPADVDGHSPSVPESHPASLWPGNSEPEATEKQKGDSPSDAEAGAAVPGKPEASENPEAPTELTSAVRRIARPGSTRPAPPRVRRQDSAEVPTADRAGNGKTVSNVIVDSQGADSEDDDQFVVEAAPQGSELAELESGPAMELKEDERHGGLVKKILETKKDYEKVQQLRPGEKARVSPAQEKSLVFESAWKKEKDIVTKEIEKLRTSIQSLCRSALPLGKVMDYIQEDVDAMHNELGLWRQERRQHAEALQKEQSITDSAVEPLKAELGELEQLIRDQQDKICAVKANILRNDEKIQKLVYTLSARR
ncbi:TRAF3-interacting protein 1 isoform X1 [Sorex araneus]|uniref:TRAF3-interacting protein 1 isoform X1 n=1 Tax=Sorex araneus TaxID=42254 RepID=UPI0024338474|nr:TRAF3-interacting protein 1 isoform X1 [Sorex araneus]